MELADQNSAPQIPPVAPDASPAGPGPEQLEAWSAEGAEFSMRVTVSKSPERLVLEETSCKLNDRMPLGG